MPPKRRAALTIGMNFLQRLNRVLTGDFEREIRAAMPSGVTPPPRTAAPFIPASEAPSIPAVFRALQIIQTSVEQLSIDVERGGRRLEAHDIPALIRRPNLDMPRSEFLGQLAMSLAATGNAYIYRDGGATRSETTQLIPLNPHLVQPWKDQKTGVVKYNFDGKTYGTDRIKHLKFLAMPGQIKGVGAIGAAQNTMRSARDLSNYSANWWETGQPSGILSTESVLTAADAQLMRNAWNHLDADGTPIDQSANPSRVRVLGKGLSYQPIMLSPRDALWIEAQNFEVLDIARIFGVPSTLMLTSIEGGSMTYSNVEQEWLSFVRFTLSAYTRKIEEALTDLSPIGQTVRFNFDALLRSDTAARYEAHKTAIEAGFMTINEVRAIENLPPLTEEVKVNETVE